MANVFAFVPARSGSKRIPNKNLVDLNGHPLIAYTLNAARQAGIFKKIIVSTDSDVIAEISSTYGSVTNKLRTPEISGETSPDIEWVKFELQNVEHENEDLFMILRPTNPLRESITIVSALELFSKNQQFDSLRAMRPVKEHPGKMWRRLDGSLEVTAFNSRINKITGTQDHSSPMQTLEPLLIQDASLEITTAKSINKHNTISGSRVMAFEMPGYEGFDINYPDDLSYLEFLNSTGRITLPNIKI